MIRTPAAYPTLLAALLFVSFSSISLAGSITPGVYELFDHPDGAISTVDAPYGLRLDTLDPPPGNGPTFSVVEPPGIVTLTWQFGATTAKIEGVIRNNTTNQDWEVDYTISGISLVLDGFVASAGSGALTALAVADVGSEPEGTIVNLLGEQNNNGHAFVFRADGYRLSGDNMSPVGRGWLVGTGSADDWLIIGNQLNEFVVPEPSAVVLLCLAAGFVARRSE